MVKNLMRKEVFDVNNTNHIEEYKYFLQNNKWKSDFIFELEFPYLTVPDMIKDKLLRKFLNA